MRGAGTLWYPTPKIQFLTWTIAVGNMKKKNKTKWKKVPENDLFQRHTFPRLLWCFVLQELLLAASHQQEIFCYFSVRGWIWDSWLGNPVSGIFRVKENRQIRIPLYTLCSKISLLPVTRENKTREVTNPEMKLARLIPVQLWISQWVLIHLYIQGHPDSLCKK